MRRWHLFTVIHSPPHFERDRSTDLRLRTRRVGVHSRLTDRSPNSLQVRAVADLSIGDVRPACERAPWTLPDVAAQLADRAIPSAPTSAPAATPQRPRTPAGVADGTISSTTAPTPIRTITKLRAVRRARSADARRRAPHRAAQEGRRSRSQKLKQAEEQLLNKDIPELLARMRLDECTTASGIQVKVKREIKASLPGHDRVEARMGALRWLVEHGHGGVIKNNVTRSRSIAAPTIARRRPRRRAARQGLRRRGEEGRPRLARSARSCASWWPTARSCRRDLFNLFDMRIAKLTRK